MILVGLASASQGNKWLRIFVFNISKTAVSYKCCIETYLRHFLNKCGKFGLIHSLMHL